MTDRDPILVPLDGSPLAEQAAAVAAALARTAGASVHLVHVHVRFPADPIYVEGIAVLDEDLQPRRREHEQAYLESVRAGLGGGEDVLTRVIDGAPAPALAEYARRSRARLVVLTTHGRGGLERAWLGSVADALVRESEVPVLLVRPGAGPVAAPFRRILVPLDGSPLSAAILGPAIGLARLEPGSEIVLLHVAPPPLPAVLMPRSVLPPAATGEELARAQEASARRWLDGAAARVRSEGVRVQTEIVRAVNAAAGILDAAGRHEADLVALSTHGRSGLRRLTLGSVADKVVRASTTPVLVYRPPDGAGDAATGPS